MNKTILIIFLVFSLSNCFGEEQKDAFSLGTSGHFLLRTDPSAALLVSHQFSEELGRYQSDSHILSKNDPFGLGMTYHMGQLKKMSLGGEYTPKLDQFKLLFSFWID